jgi:threonine synthase
MTSRPLPPDGGSGIIRRFSEFLDVTDKTPIISLGEGNTPLIYSERLSSDVNADVWLKYEGLNPTGSFKDRGMTLAISRAVENGARAVICASTGNTSASAAAYAARAGLGCVVLVPAGGVAGGKLAQAVAHGALVLEVDGSFDTALDLGREVAGDDSATLVNSLNPHRIDGQKTAAFEVVQTLGRAPDIHVMPVGNAGNMTAYWRGYEECLAVGWCSDTPAMFGFQARGADPIVQGRRIDNPTTVASAIRIGNPASWKGAVDASTASGGGILAVSDDAIVQAHHRLAGEGIFVELASAASIAGLRALDADHTIPRGAVVVCVLTGHGLKDASWSLGEIPPPVKVDATRAAVAGALRDHGGRTRRSANKATRRDRSPHARHALAVEAEE